MEYHRFADVSQDRPSSGGRGACGGGVELARRPDDAPAQLHDPLDSLRMLWCQGFHLEQLRFRQQRREWIVQSVHQPQRDIAYRGKLLGGVILRLGLHAADLHDWHSRRLRPPSHPSDGPITVSVT